MKKLILSLLFVLTGALTAFYIDSPKDQNNKSKLFSSYGPEKNKFSKPNKPLSGEIRILKDSLSPDIFSLELDLKKYASLKGSNIKLEWETPQMIYFLDSLSISHIYPFDQLPNQIQRQFEINKNFPHGEVPTITAYITVYSANNDVLFREGIVARALTSEDLQEEKNSLFLNDKKPVPYNKNTSDSKVRIFY